MVIVSMLSSLVSLYYGKNKILFFPFLTVLVDSLFNFNSFIEFYSISSIFVYVIFCLIKFLNVEKLDNFFLFFLLYFFFVLKVFILLIPALTILLYRYCLNPFIFSGIKFIPLFFIVINFISALIYLTKIRSFTSGLSVVKGQFNLELINLLFSFLLILNISIILVFLNYDNLRLKLLTFLTFLTYIPNFTISLFIYFKKISLMNTKSLTIVFNEFYKPLFLNIESLKFLKNNHLHTVSQEFIFSSTQQVVKNDVLTSLNEYSEIKFVVTEISKIEKLINWVSHNPFTSLGGLFFTFLFLWFILNGFPLGGFPDTPSKIIKSFDNQKYLKESITNFKNGSETMVLKAKTFDESFLSTEEIVDFFTSIGEARPFWFSIIYNLGPDTITKICDYISQYGDLKKIESRKIAEKVSILRAIDFFIDSGEFSGNAEVTNYLNNNCYKYIQETTFLQYLVEKKLCPESCIGDYLKSKEGYNFYKDYINSYNYCIRNFTLEYYKNSVKCEGSPRAYFIMYFMDHRDKIQLLMEDQLTWIESCLE